MMKIKKLLLVFFLVIPPSCSVWESREACPCVLGLDCSGCVGYEGKLIVAGKDIEGEECFRDSDFQSDRGGYREFFVPRCMLAVTVVCSPDGLSEGGDCIVAETGCQADSVYASLSVISTETEYCYHKARLYKQFATVRFVVSGAADGEKTRYVARSSVCGLSLKDLAPVSGCFECVPVREESGIYSFRVFRQDGNLLELEIVPGSGSGCRVLNLLEVLSSVGYDWSEPGLRDVDIVMNSADMTLSVRVEEWDESEKYNVEL